MRPFGTNNSSFVKNSDLLCELQFTQKFLEPTHSIPPCNWSDQHVTRILCIGGEFVSKHL